MRAPYIFIAFSAWSAQIVTHVQYIFLHIFFNKVIDSLILKIPYFWKKTLLW